MHLFVGRLKGGERKGVTVHIDGGRHTVLRGGSEAFLDAFADGFARLFFSALLRLGRENDFGADKDDVEGDVGEEVGELLPDGSGQTAFRTST